MERQASRLTSIDAVRGAVMILMALDHVRDFVHSAAGQFRPEDLTRTSVPLFFTRWITHFCAPVFMFYAGIGAYLWASRGRSRAELSRFLLIRGLWLILLELTVVRFGFFFNFDYSAIILLVFWALGCGMVALAGLVYLPSPVLAGLSVAMIALHNLFDGVQGGTLWKILHQVAPFQAAGHTVIPSYSLIPWIGVMAAGYCFGRVFQFDPVTRRKVLLRTGAVLAIAFVVIRASNLYGDPGKWSVQNSPVFTLLSFLNCTKYPPSLLFLLMTLGPALLVTGWIDRMRFSPNNPLIVFGRVPLFYFVLHFWSIHLIAAVLLWLRQGNPSLFWNGPPAMGGPLPDHYGYNLWVVYAVWISLVAMLYPVCRWFARLKERRKDWWLSYC
jgi:uncharacterized membrane protein